MDLKKIEFEGEDWTYLAHDRDRCQGVMNARMKIWVL
jgi:hypothetical protein